ncbi:glutathione peroxidase [Solitalea koreensis]|uniref:Glutathione peroxidase n=1 Tax=Solitalea koreensis TaxID=543615 RepID=A0A521DX97_9SPHI|nr:glutathione peroxidase [Solitalea koreensis]SMO76242.1 glutathione peroxidase [Solitalea koreensis]
MSIINIYSHKVEQINGEEISLERFKGKVLLIVNTASECGYTPQLQDLEQLRNEFMGQDFEVLGFPSNDFGTQEPRNGEEIIDFCKDNYGVTFPIFGKIHVKGEKAHPLYKYLSRKSENGKLNSIPLWNFHKYLIDKEGNVVDYFLTITKPMSSKIRNKIKQLLEK